MHLEKCYIYTYLKDVDLIQCDSVRVSGQFRADVVVDFFCHLERVSFR